MDVKVSIPVKTGGYTGQFDRWEEYEHPYTVVANEDGTVSLEGTGSAGRKITFKMDDLQKAVRFYQENVT